MQEEQKKEKRPENQPLFARLPKIRKMRYTHRVNH